MRPFGFSRHRVLLMAELPPDAVSRLERFFDVQSIEEIEHGISHGVMRRDSDDALSGRSPGAPNGDGLAALLHDKAGVIALHRHVFDGNLIRRLPALKAICNFDARHDNLDLPALTRAGIRATHVPATHEARRGGAIWEALLADMRTADVPRAALFRPMNRRWSASVNFGTSPADCAVAVIGEGPVARALAARLRVAGAHVPHFPRVPSTGSDPATPWRDADWVIIDPDARADTHAWEALRAALSHCKPHLRMLAISAQARQWWGHYSPQRLIPQPQTGETGPAEYMDAKRDSAADINGTDDMDAGLIVAEQLIAALGFGRDSWHPAHLLNPDVVCESCC